MKFFQKDELRLLWPFYFSKFAFIIFNILIPFEALYFLDLGFSLFQVGIITASLALAAFLFEIPTGAVADLYGRKASSLIGYFLSAIVAFSIFFARGFYLIITLYFLLGFAKTFISGAEQAWIVDKLHQNKKKNLIHDYFAKSHSFFSAGFLISGVVGSILVGIFGLSVIWPMLSLHFLMTGILLSFVKEEHKKANPEIRGHYQKFIKQTKESISYSFSHYNLRLFMFGLVFIALAVMLLSGLTWYPFMESAGLNKKYLGYLFSITWAIAMVIPHFTKKIVKFFGGYKRYLVATWIAIFLTTILVLFFNNLIALIVVYVISSSMWDFHHIGKNPFFQQFIPSSMRATIKSLEMQIIALVSIFGRILAGFLADTIGLRYTLGIGAFLVIPLIIIYSKMKEIVKIK